VSENKEHHMQTKNLTFSLLIGVVLLAATNAIRAAEVVTYYHLDALGSPVAATNAQGQVIWREQYKPYGERIQKDPASQNNPRWYTGHLEDPETGLTYAGARYYDPVVGRFMGVDPKGFSEGDPFSFNRYVYANGNPYRNVDPDGRDSLDLSDLLRSALRGAGTSDPDIIIRNLDITIQQQDDDKAKFLRQAVETAKTAAALAQTIDNLVKTSQPLPETKGRTKAFDRGSGGLEQANREFDTLGPKNVREIPDGGRVGQLSDGRTAIVRSRSTDSNRPTLEIQDGKNRTKFRY